MESVVASKDLRFVWQKDARGKWLRTTLPLGVIFSDLMEVVRVGEASADLKPLKAELAKGNSELFGNSDQQDVQEAWTNLLLQLS